MSERPNCIATTIRTQQPCPNKAEWKRGRYCHIHDPYGKNQKKRSANEAANK